MGSGLVRRGMEIGDWEARYFVHIENGKLGTQIAIT